MRPAMRIPYAAFRRRLGEKLQDQASRYGVARQKGLFPRSSFQLVYDPYVRGAHPTWGNIVNESTCCMSPLNADDLHEMAFEVPFAWRQNERFALRVLRELYPPILDVPFYCHCRPMTFDRKSIELRQPWGLQLLDGAAHFLEKSRIGRGVFEAMRRTRIGHVVRRLQKDLQQDQRKRFADPDVERARTLSQELPVFQSLVRAEQEEQNLRLLDPNAYAGDLFSLAKYWKLLYGIRKVREAAAAP